MSPRTASVVALAAAALACTPAAPTATPAPASPPGDAPMAALVLAPYATASGTRDGLTVTVKQIVRAASRESMAASLHLTDGAAATDVVIWSDAPTTTWRGYQIDVQGWSTASITARVSRGKTP